MASSMLLFPRIVHMGGGASRLLPQVLNTLSLRRPLLVTDPFLYQNSKILPDLLQAWKTTPDDDMEVFYETVPDPTSDVVQEGLRRVQAYQPDCLVAVGGGSPIDTAKAMAAPTPSNDDNPSPPLPIIAIPTTSGTGSEMTRVCVITDSTTGEKKLFAAAAMQPTAALVDYQLTLDLPPRVTADTGIDALVHAVEAYVSRKQHPVPDGYCLAALRDLGPALRPAYHEGAQREAMMRGASLAGLAFNNSSVALVHGMSRPLGAHFHLTHGASNAVLFPTLTRWSLESSSALERYATVARELGLAQNAALTTTQVAHCLVDELLALNQDLHVPTLRQSGISAADWEKMIPTMAQQALASGSPNNNPRIPTQAEVEDLYRLVYEESW